MLPLGSPYEKFLSIGFLPIPSEQFSDLNVNNAATHQDFTLAQPPMFFDSDLHGQCHVPTAMHLGFIFVRQGSVKVPGQGYR